MTLLSGWEGPTNLHEIYIQLDRHLGNARYATLEVRREFILAPFSRHISQIVGAIAVSQLIIGAPILSRGWALRLGLMGAMVFLPAIARLGTRSAFPAIVLMAIAANILLYHDWKSPLPFLPVAILRSLVRR